MSAMAIICWMVAGTSFTGCGQPMDRAMAQVWIERLPDLDRQSGLPEITYWLKDANAPMETPYKDGVRRDGRL